MADVKPLKLVDQGAGVGRLAEFEAGDTLPKAALPALSAADVGAVAAGDPRLSDAREWTAETVSQAEAEAGTATTRRAWTAQRVRQAIVAWWNSVSSVWGRGFVGSADAAAGRAALSVREQLTANRTYFVRTDGSDSNNGLTNTSGGAFLTIQRAVDVVASLDIGIFNVTINIMDGSYNVGKGVRLKSLVGAGTVTIQGSGASPINTQVFTTGSLLPTEAVFFAAGITGSWRVTNVGIYSTGSGAARVGVQASAGSRLTVGAIDYGAGFTAQARAIDSGALEIDSNYSISSGAGTSIESIGSSAVRIQNITVTIVGNPSFNSFCSANQCGVVVATGNAFIGTANGPRYIASLNGVINTGGAGASYFPGDTSGAAVDGGRYA